MKKVILQIQGIVKAFPGVLALNNVDFNLHEKEIHALIGENGSGKSTLMNILVGVYQPDEGKIQMDGNDIVFKDTKDAQNNGIAMIHQELSLAPTLTVMENIFVGRQPKSKFGLIDYKKMKSSCDKMLEDFEIIDIKSDDIVKNLSLSQMQLIEIVKALALKSKILIMDEPTAALTKKETELLLKRMEKIKEKCSIIFISHRLDEIKTIADRITVLRDGEHITTKPNEKMEICDIINCMVGRELTQFYKRVSCAKDELVMSVSGITNHKIKNITFDIRRGEVLGLTGLVGSGRTELLQTLFGDIPYKPGKIEINNEEYKVSSISKAIIKKIALVPEGRKTQSVFLNLSVRENISIVKQNSCKKLGFIKSNEVNKLVYDIKDKLKIKTPSLKNQIINLSGGNQQKTILGRWLINAPQLILLDEPTHGIDVGAKMEIYEIIDQLAQQGVSILLVSSELPEILNLCDRVMVMHQGEITAILENNNLDQEIIMTYATNQNKNKKNNV